ncbi:MAG TPA: hypothetical protein VEJ18_21700 [Planctomycetota bacterium]|nr:hypothetical protein [Planctomycetota bacterium]
MPLLLTTVVAVLLHLAFGWVWTPLAAFVGGWARLRGAAWRGATALFLSWGLFVGWTYVVDAAGASRAAGLLAGVMGGLPGAVSIVLALAVAALLGALAGTAGAASRALTSPLTDDRTVDQGSSRPSVAERPQA